MAKLNMLKGAYSGKLGETIGSKWKDLNTVRVYTKPTNPNTPAQQQIRTIFKNMTEYVALFSDQLKSLSPLDTRGMSVRNAIIKLNKEQFAGATFDPTLLVVSKGSLPNVTDFTTLYEPSENVFRIFYTSPKSPRISEKARFVTIVINETQKIANVGNGPTTQTQFKIPMTIEVGDQITFFYYMLDFRGSARVGSNSSIDRPVMTKKEETTPATPAAPAAADKTKTDKKSPDSSGSGLGV